MRKLRSDQRGKYYCLYCLLSFDSPCSLTRHNQEHFDKRNYKTKFLTPQIICILCKKKFFKKSSFLNHLMDKLHVNSPLLQPRVFAKRHSQAAKSNQSLKCSVCTKKFLKSSIYEKHKLFHRSSNLLECPNCFKSLDSLKKVLKHKSIHLKKEKKFECFCCKQEFSKYFSLLSHFQSKICSWNRKAKQKPILFQTQGKNTKSKESWPNIAPQRISENINKEFFKSCTSEPYSLDVFNSNSQFRSHLEESGHINEDSKNSEVSIKDSDSDLEIGNEAASKIINIISPKMKYECPLC